MNEDLGLLVFRMRLFTAQVEVYSLPNTLT